MYWTTIAFGKHQGKSLPQIMFTDPDWFYWAKAKGLFDNNLQLTNESSELLRKSANIALPEIDGETQHVEHYIHYPTMRYSHFILVPECRQLHAGSSPVIRQDRLDMSVPSSISKFDKLGHRNFLKSFRAYILPGRISQNRAEQFFSEDANFEGHAEAGGNRVWVES